MREWWGSHLRNSRLRAAANNLWRVGVAAAALLRPEAGMLLHAVGMLVVIKGAFETRSRITNITVGF